MRVPLPVILSPLSVILRKARSADEESHRTIHRRRIHITCACAYITAQSHHAPQAHITFSPTGRRGRRPLQSAASKKKRHSLECLMDPGSCLSSRAVSSQVLSVYVRLTSVFGMGTGGTAQLNHRKGVVAKQLENCIFRNSL